MKNVRPLSIGFSPCPNDTFIFHALMHGLVADPRIEFARETLADVETLNEWALSARLDVSKISFHAFGHVLDDYILLAAGSALGRGCGPLLVAGRPLSIDELADKRVAIPGNYTTAAMLLRLFAPRCGNLVVMRFDRIMPALAAGECDAGVIIHESRFTYPQYGLQLLQDLGAWWESVSGHPIPLGGIVARRALGCEKIGHIQQLIKESVRWAFAHPDDSRPYIRQHAQEMDEQVTRSHIGLYVNSYSEDLGAKGVEAVGEFIFRGRAAGVIPAGRDDWFAADNRA
ncbi:MAG: 1,4-dihydroxy-6-naphthoate synthase [Desulfobulbaceae bacterium]|nr:1,4-dihydroxy-6-naphthoate synthase [Desulfobulbaceae bacterium]